MTTRLIDDVLKYQNNPVLIQKAILDKLSEVANGIEIVDPSNPFVFALEAATSLTAAFMIKNEVNTRKQYPFSAQTPEDLYLHMSDRDYINRFAIPTETVFTLMFRLDELEPALVLDSATGIKKIIIPRNTYFTITDITFSIQHPIEIQLLQHGGYQVIYDLERQSPIQTLRSNLIDHQILVDSTGEWLGFSVDVQQFNIVSQSETVNAATDFKQSITLTDQYYFTRVYAQQSNGTYVEIRTTHTDQTYDVTVPTALLKVIDNTVEITIPQIYTGTGLLSSGVRIDVYQTKGPLNIILWEYPFAQFTASWVAYDPNDTSVFTAPLRTLRTAIVYSDRAVSGGANAIDFLELRRRVINNSVGPDRLPITNAQIETALINDGYQLVKNIDTITNRVFLATKELPMPTNTNLVTRANANIETISFTITSLLSNAGVIDNGENVTITPDVLYRTNGGITSIVTNTELSDLLAKPATTRAILVTNRNYLFTPFHYVLSTKANTFDLRPYYLDNPIIETKLFTASNDTTLLQVGTDTYNIIKTVAGYTLQIVTRSSTAYKDLNDNEVYVQLAYIPAGERDRAYLNGTLVGKTDTNERIFSFDLSSNFDVDAEDNLSLRRFFLYTREPRLTKANLLTVFDVIYSTSTAMGSNYVRNAVDEVLGTFLLPNRIAGIVHERLRVRFGYGLKTLWARARSTVSETIYKRQPIDIPKVYTEDVYKTDAFGSAVQFDANGNVFFEKLHSKNDPVLDSDGNPVYLVRAGDVVRDSLGNPVVADARGILRQIDIMLIEGAYWFATDNQAINYRNTLIRTLVDNLTNDLTKLTSELLEQTRIYFYPKATLGILSVLVENGITKIINANQSFNVTLYVNARVYENNPLRRRLSETTVLVINAALTKETVSIDEITSKLRAQYGEDVISVKVTGLGGADNLQTLTVIDNGKRCSIKKRLTAIENNSLIVEEDVSISFVRHELA